MEFLAGQGFVHRDLACRNILLFNENDVKIGDFGMMRRISESGEYKMEESRKIPIAWSAPESLRKKLFSEKSDVWSFGVLLWEVFTFGDMPWKGSNAKQIITMIEQGVRLNIAKFVTQKVWDLIEQLWKFNPAQRPGFGSIVKKLLEVRYM